ncbi:MAG: glycosyltransferase family 2 protein [bacterium]|nr:glycosyltransferase family 2 protein [bacterium]
MKLSIVIPAYNEEEAIGVTIERCLKARAGIVAGSPVDSVELIVVSDGSDDRTVEIARSYDEVRVEVFETNRGYGAAIKRGFEVGDGELVAFLDADGTCDPEFFTPLCSELIRQDAVIALGSRMGPSSRMPRIRRIGNTVYAAILSILSNRMVTDTASGMRVIRRDALDPLYPLPDGLHFTPAMSARALMDDQMKIIEIPMKYEERVGESKLNVLRDGVRFFQTIFEMTLIWRPARILLSGAGLCITLTVLLAMHPIEMWVRERRLEEWMIYRLLFCSLLGSVAMTMVSASVIAKNMHAFLAGGNHQPGTLTLALERFFSIRGLTILLLPFALVTVALIGRGMWTYLVAGEVTIHWSRVVLAGLVGFVYAHSWVTCLMLNLVKLHVQRYRHLHGSSPCPSSGAPEAVTAPVPVEVRTPIVATS